jgi:adenine nucleotide transporter 17
VSNSVVKSRLQAGTANSLKYKSSLDGLLTIIKEEGVEGLYKGIGSKIIQSVLTAAILFAGQRRIFEMTKSVSHFHLLQLAAKFSGTD